jgi:hypothetical protein
MPIQVQIAIVAVGLAALGIAVLRLPRRAVAGTRLARLRGMVASLAGYGLLVAASGLLLFTCAPRGLFTRQAASPPASPSGSKAVSPEVDAKYRAAVIGTWTDNYRGTRTMTLREDGTGTMVVELSGIQAALFAGRLTFNMIWSVEGGRLKKQTLGGEPADRVDLILKTMGDRVDEPILELDGERLVLLDGDGETTYTWTRVP